MLTYLANQALYTFRLQLAHYCTFHLSPLLLQLKLLILPSIFHLTSEDYVPFPPQLTLSGGASAGSRYCFTIAVIDDDVFEADNETFTITLSTDDAAVCLNTIEATAAIYEKEGLPNVLLMWHH